MIPKRMIEWGSQGSIIRDLAAFGDRRAQEVGAENVLNFTIGNPSVPAPACVAESIQRQLRTVPPQELHAYTPAPGLPAVREKMAAYLRETFGIPYTAEDLYLTHGASSALAIAMQGLLSPGDEVVTLAPFFPEYRAYAEAAGAALVAVPSLPGSFQLDLPALERAVNPKTAMLLLNSPNNPSGAILSRESIAAIADLLTRRSREYEHPIYLLADEPYRELVYSGAEVPFIPSYYPDTLYCYSFSKSLSLPGERVGFLALTPGMTDYTLVRSGIYGAGRVLGYINVSSLFQRVCAECMGKTADLSVYAENRDVIYQGLTALGYDCVRPDGAFYLFVAAPDGDSQSFCQKAMAQDILLVPGDEFGCPGYARLAYCVELDKLRRSLPRFAALAREYGLTEVQA